MHTIMGIGIDIVEIGRISRAVEKNRRFLERVFTQKEIEIFEKKGFKVESIAGGFAAKEAVSKAVGTGIGQIAFRDIEILRNELGKPFVAMEGRLGEICSGIGVDGIMISISHSREYAVSNAIAVKSMGR